MSSVASLERGLKILDLLIEVEADVARKSRGLAIQQVASELGVHKSTASRLMQTLVANGYATPMAGASRGFRLGPAAQIHQPLSIDQRQLRELAQPILRKLVEQTGECAHAAVAVGQAALVVDDVETRQPLRVVAGRGRRVPLHCTSAGKCLLAYGLAVMPDTLPARTARTITNPEMLRLHLDEIARRGYAVDDEENDPGVRCISAPVFTPSGEPFACVGIDGPSVRMPPEKDAIMAEFVTAAATDLTARLVDAASHIGASTAR